LHETARYIFPTNLLSSMTSPEKMVLLCRC
jgi:hypothetical protein